MLIDAAAYLLSPVEARLGRHHVERAAATIARDRPRIVAITGSYGKTSTKGYVAHLLNERYSLLASPRSFNNKAGLARTVNEHWSRGLELFVAEMGTYAPGEIAAMCSWLPPSVAVITAIGPVHLERFKRLEVTLKAKAEIAQRAPEVVLNVDDVRLAELAKRLEAEGKTVVRASGGAPAGGAVPEVVVALHGHALELQVGCRRVGCVPLERDAALPVPSNVACAVGVALGLGMPPEQVLARLDSLPVAENRLTRSVTPSGVIVLDDTFNSNPAGARVALSELARQGAPGARRVLVTPGMVELGPLQFAENRALALAAGEIANELLVVARTNRAALLEGARLACERGSRVNVVVVDRREQAVAWVRAQLEAGDVVLYENDLPDHYP